MLRCHFVCFRLLAERFIKLTQPLAVFVIHCSPSATPYLDNFSIWDNGHPPGPQLNSFVSSSIPLNPRPLESCIKRRGQMCRMQFTLHVCHEASIKRRRINAPLLELVYHFESASLYLEKMTQFLIRSPLNVKSICSVCGGWSGGVIIIMMMMMMMMMYYCIVLYCIYTFI